MSKLSLDELKVAQRQFHALEQCMATAGCDETYQLYITALDFISRPIAFKKVTHEGLTVFLTLACAMIPEAKTLRVTIHVGPFHHSMLYFRELNNDSTIRTFVEGVERDSAAYSEHLGTTPLPCSALGTFRTRDVFTYRRGTLRLPEFLDLSGLLVQGQSLVAIYVALEGIRQVTGMIERDLSNPKELPLVEDLRSLDVEHDMLLTMIESWVKRGPPTQTHAREQVDAPIGHSDTDGDASFFND